MNQVCICILCCFFAGCAHCRECVTRTTFTRYTATRYHPKSEDDRIVILASMMPERHFEEIGVIRIVRSSGCLRNNLVSDQYSDEQALIKKAREVGADAVVDIKAGALGIETGTAIVFRDGE